ncbi:hypothetical protein WJX72_006021 [[Myrmecia] bisecta]|uniref:Multidrug and toxic compound extrusion protein n=1 Tax=[Myrmecia] bisecta TaxID=41462 RepID=A0AAW1QQX9_9CHLO
MLASALAAGDQQKAGRVVIQASTLAVALGTGVTAALMMGSDQLLLLMGAAPDTHASTFTLAREYLVYRACAAPAALLMTVGQGTFRGLEDMRTPLAVSLGANLLHLGLAPALIYGAHMGVSGAAVATAACETGAALAYTGLLWQRRDVLGLWPLPALSLQEVQADYLPFLHAGGAVLARTFLLLGTKTLASAVATRLGTVSIAAHQVLMQLWLLASMVVDSLAVSGQTLVAVALGRGATREARDISDRLLQMGMALGLGIAFLYAICGPFLPHLFSSDAAVNDQVLALLPLAVSLLPINSLVYVLDGVFVGASDFKFLAGAMVLAAASTLVLLLVVEPLDLGLEGVWTALAVLMVGRLTTLGWRYQAVNGPLPASFSTSRTTDPQVDAGPAFQHLNGVAGVDCADPVVCSREADAAHDEVPGNSVSSQ